MPRNAKRKIKYWLLIKNLGVSDYRVFHNFWTRVVGEVGYPQASLPDFLESKAREWYLTVYKPRKQQTIGR